MKKIALFTVCVMLFTMLSGFSYAKTHEDLCENSDCRLVVLTCPRCGSTHINAVSGTANTYRCADCSYQWKMVIIINPGDIQP